MTILPEDGEEFGSGEDWVRYNYDPENHDHRDRSELGDLGLKTFETAQQFCLKYGITLVSDPSHTIVELLTMAGITISERFKLAEFMLYQEGMRRQPPLVVIRKPGRIFPTVITQTELMSIYGLYLHIERTVIDLSLGHNPNNTEGSSDYE